MMGIVGGEDTPTLLKAAICLWPGDTVVMVKLYFSVNGGSTATANKLRKARYLYIRYYDPSGFLPCN